MREDLGSARRAATWLVGLLAVSMGVNLLLAVSALRLAGQSLRVAVVVTPEDALPDMGDPLRVEASFIVPR